MTNTGIEKKNYDSIDLLKIILSVLIVQIHSDFYLPWMKPYVRLAVPLFFIISAYLKPIVFCKSLGFNSI